MRRKRVALETLWQVDGIAAENGGQTPQFPVKWIRKTVEAIIEGELSERQREILLRYYYQDMTIRDIAAELNLAPSSVSRSLRRSRTVLAHFLQYCLLSS